MNTNLKFIKRKYYDITNKTNYLITVKTNLERQNLSKNIPDS